MTSKQRASLRALASQYDTILQVGKEGVSPATVKQVDDALTARQLIKLRALPNAPEDAGTIAASLAEAVSAEVVQVIGTKMILYRRNLKKPDLLA